MREPKQQDYLTTSQLAMRPGFPGADTLYAWRSGGKGPPYVKIGGRVFYRAADLARWEESNLIVPPAAAKSKILG